MSPLAAIAHDDVVYWMGFEEFYVFSGQVQRIPCTVRSYVFDDFNREQKRRSLRRRTRRTAKSGGSTRRQQLMKLIATLYLITKRMLGITVLWCVQLGLTVASMITQWLRLLMAGNISKNWVWMTLLLVLLWLLTPT